MPLEIYVRENLFLHFTNFGKKIYYLLDFLSQVLLGSPSRDEWINSLGEYPEDFTCYLDYVSCDLDDPESLYHLL